MVPERCQTRTRNLSSSHVKSNHFHLRARNITNYTTPCSIQLERMQLMTAWKISESRFPSHESGFLKTRESRLSWRKARKLSYTNWIKIEDVCSPLHVGTPRTRVKPSCWWLYRYGGQRDPAEQKCRFGMLSVFSWRCELSSLCDSNYIFYPPVRTLSRLSISVRQWDYECYDYMFGMVCKKRRKIEKTAALA